MAKRKPSTSPADKQQEETRLIESMVIEHTLFEIFAEALEKDRIVTPDDAVKELSLRLSEVLAEVNNAPNWLSAVHNVKLRLYPSRALQKAHHMAVDLFYELYGVPKKGAPTVPYFHLVRILRLDAEGLSPFQIAERLEWPTSSPEEREKSTDRIKKQLRIARKRLPLIAYPQVARRGK